MVTLASLYPLAFLILTFIAGGSTLYLLQTDISLQTFLQIIALAGLLIFASSRLFFEKIRLRFGARLAYLIEGFPVLLFVYLLVFSTGGISSPFLVLTHFLALACAFLLSPNLALGFIFITIGFLVGHTYTDPSAKAFLLESPFAVILYFIAYLALIPLAYVLAREYKVKEEWVRRLQKQLALSRKEEEELLGNIADPVFVLNRNFEIVYANNAAMNWGFSQKDLGQYFFHLEEVKDKNGETLDAQSMSFPAVLETKSPTVIEDVQLSKKGGFEKVDLKLLPVISAEGSSLGMVLIAKEHKPQTKKGEVSELALSRFAEVVARQKNELFALEKKTEPQNLEKLSQQTEILEGLAQDFVYTLKLESGEVGAISSIFDLSQVISGVFEREKAMAQDLSVKLEQKGKFREASVLGNVAWMNDALFRMLTLALYLCGKGKKVVVELFHEKELVKLQIMVETSLVPKEKVGDLFEKFYGSLSGIPTLSQTTGLEGYLAKSLIERMGGSVAAEAISSPPLLVFSITFGTEPPPSS